MIKFLQHSSPQYPPRTYENASADVTIAFAFDFNTPGERLTRDAVKAQGKIYVPISPHFTSADITTAIYWLNKVNAKVINIAGNGAYTTIKHRWTQAHCDEEVSSFFDVLFSRGELRTLITLMRSGGQSGFDESGLKAAIERGIPALCVCPSGWKFKDVNGITHCDEQLFKNRFNSEIIL